MKKNLLIGVIAILLVGTGFFVVTKQNSKPPTPVTNSNPQASPSAITEKKPTTDTSNWIVYVNKTYNYSIKFPGTYEIQPGSDEQNTCVRPNVGSPCEVFINAYPNKDNLSLGGYMDKNMIMLEIDGPLQGAIFNGYDSVFNKNRFGTNVFVKQGQYVYHINAATASQDKEIGDIVATFKFTQ